MQNSERFTAFAERYWRSGRSYMTKSRESVCRLIERVEPIFDFPDLEREAARTNSPARLATIYRVIADLVQGDLLWEIFRSDGHRSFIKHTECQFPLSYLICPKCQRARLLDTSPIQAAQAQLMEIRGYDSSTAHIRFEGLCSHCSEKPSLFPPRVPR